MDLGVLLWIFLLIVISFVRAQKTVRLHGDAAGRREIEPCVWHDHAITVTGESRPFNRSGHFSAEFAL